MIIRQFIFALAFTLLSSPLFSQQFFFRKYSVEEGLAQSSVRCLLQDSRGFIWAGTVGGGLSRFDGYRFDTFTKAEGLTDNIVRSLFEDSRGNIYIGTDNGLTIYDGKEFTRVNEEKGLRGTSVLKIIEGKNGIIWVGTNDGGLSAIRITDTLEVTNYSIENGLVSNFIFDIYEAADNRLWLGMVGGVNIIELSASDSLFITDIERLDFEPQMILSLEEGSDGSVLIGTYGDGLFRAVQDKERNIAVTPSSINSSFPGLIVWDIYNFSADEIWLATDNSGILKLQNDKVISMFNKDNGMPSNQILDITVDNEGNAWFASFDQGIIMFDDEKFISYGPKESLTGNQVLSIYLDSDNLVYLATDEGFSCFEKDDSRLTLKRFYSRRDGLLDEGANVIARYDDQIWIGTNNGINIFNGSKLTSFSLNDRLPDRRINALYADSRDNLWIGTSGGYCKYSGGSMIKLTQSEGLINGEIQSIIEDSQGRIWMGTMGGLVRLEDSIYTDFDFEEGLSSLRINSLAEGPEGSVWIGTFDGGIYRFENKQDSMPLRMVADRSTLSSNNINSLVFLVDTLLVAGTDIGFEFINLGNDNAIEKVVSYDYKDGFSGRENNTNSVAIDRDGFIWFGTKNGLIRFDPRMNESYNYSPSVSIEGIKLFYEDVDWTAKGFLISKWSGVPENLILSHRDNHLTFEYSGLYFSNPDDLMFSYSLERNQDGEWSPYSKERNTQFQGLSPGHYSFKVRARSKYGVTSDVASYDFRIKPPFWQTKAFISSMTVTLFLLVFFFIKYREKKLIRENIKLENTVNERTRQVVEQKDEIERQRDILTNQKNEITDSIRAAETIQKAVLPEETLLGKYFEGYFVLFRPRDIVSGDFYWISERDHTIVFTAADCTGHGVPGALMSMLGISYLRKIVNESGITRPADVLNNLRDNIILSLKQKDAPGAIKDGMDIALCAIDLSAMRLQYAGANNPLIIIRKTPDGYAVLERKADKMPVAFHSKMESFTNHEIEIMKGDTIYLFSDGYCDQFGGPDGRKFMKHKLVKMIAENQDIDMRSQGELFNRILEDWINYPAEGIKSIGQIDDIILLGVRI